MTTINKPEILATFADHAGIKISEREAAVVLNHLASGRYHLEYDEKMQLHRYNDANQCNEEYSLQDAVEFCLERNGELQDANNAKDKSDETFAKKLQENEAALQGLTRKLNRVSDKRMSILYDKIEELDWTIYEDAHGWEIRKFSPAGEDFGFYIDECDVTDAADFIKAIREYAEDYYDAEENVAMWVKAKQVGQDASIPDIRTLVQDADDIQDMLDELVEALQDVRYLWTICYVDPQTKQASEGALEAEDEDTALCLFETDVCETMLWDEVPEILMVKCSAVPEEKADTAGMDCDESMAYIAQNCMISEEAGRLISNILRYATAIGDSKERHNFLSTVLDGTIGLTEEEIRRFLS